MCGHALRERESVQARLATLYLAHRGHVVTTTYIMNYRPQYTSVSDELTIVEHSAISVEIVFHFLKSFHRESHNDTSSGVDDIS